MNDYGFFYGSWSELLGHRDRVAAVSRADHVRTVPDGRGVVGGAGRVLDRAPFEAGRVPARDGKTVTVRLPGRRSGLAEIGFMHLPPEYFQPGWEHTQFPAVEVLTGYPGQATDLLKTLDVPAALRQDQRAGTAGPMVLVMLRSSPGFPRDTECVDMPRGPQAFTYYSQDVPAYVASLFRVPPVGWGAMGDSTGGYCASKLAVTNSYVFPAAVALSGYAAPPQDLTTGDLFGGGASLRAQSDLVHLPRTGHSPAASLLLTTTRTERGPSGLEAVWTLQRAARPPLQGSRPAAGTASARGARGFRPCWPGSPPTCTRAHRDRLRCAAGRRAPCSSRRWRRERPLTPAHEHERRARGVPCPRVRSGGSPASRRPDRGPGPRPDRRPGRDRVERTSGSGSTVTVAAPAGCPSKLTGLGAASAQRRLGGRRAVQLDSRLRCRELIQAKDVVELGLVTGLLLQVVQRAVTVPPLAAVLGPRRSLSVVGFVVGLVLG